MADSWGHAVVVGLVAQPHNVPEEVQITYSNGSVLVLRDDSLREFWHEVIQALFIVNRIKAAGQEQALQQQQEATPNIPQTFSSDAIRKHLKANELVRRLQEAEKEEDNNEEE